MTNASKNTPGNLASAMEQIGVHDHVCLIYETREEQFSTVIPFLRIGLERGEKCLYVVDDNTADAVIEGMKAAGIDAEAAIASGKLVVVSKQEAYLKQGYFDPDWMIGFLKRATVEAKAAGFSALRVTGEMTWVLGGDPGTERLMEYEAKLNYFFPTNDALAICQYNRSLFSPKVIKNVIATHPFVIYDGLVCRNFYYVPPNDFLDGEQADREIDRLLANIRSREQAEEELRLHREHLEELARERIAKAEEAIYEKQQMFRTLVENSPDIIARYDRDCKRTYVNPTYLRVAGISPQELIATTPAQRSPLPAAGATVLQSVLRRVLDSGVVEVVDVVWPKAGQGDTWYNIYAFPEFDREGRVASVMTVSRDITAHKRAVAALQVSEGRFRKLLESVTGYVYTVIVDNGQPGGTTHGIGCAAVTGYSAEEYAADPGLWYRMIIEDDRQAVVDAAQKLLRNKVPCTIEHRILHKDGSTRWVRSTLVPYVSPEGVLLAYDGVITDITERRKAEDDVRTLNGELERRIKARTAELEKRNHELEEMNKAFVGRELRMKELKEKIAELGKGSKEKERSAR